MPSYFHTTLSRDMAILGARRSFWVIVSLWAAICAMIFFAYLEDFLAIQPSLRAKNFRYGITDIVIIPYIKLQLMAALIVMTSLCSRLFYQETFAPFAALLRSTRPDPLVVVSAKMTYIALISVVLILVVALPVIGSGLCFAYNEFRVALTLFACFVVLLVVGTLAMVLSQVFSHSIVVMLVAILLSVLPEIAVRLLVEPVWLAPILAFFSPFAHINRIATGVITLSDAVFFGSLILLLLGIAVRQFNNTYLSLS